MLLVLCAALLVAGSVLGTLAYLQSQTKTISNVMTVGNVSITLSESKVDEFGKLVTGAAPIEATSDGITGGENTYKLIPGLTYTKDPKITVAANSEASYLFVKVVNGIAGVESGTTIATQMTNNGWTALSGTSDVYFKKVAATTTQAVEYPVFANFTVAENANTLTAWANVSNVTVTAYAVQADGFTTAQAAWTATFGAPANNG
jgi:hypothetical protein